MFIILNRYSIFATDTLYTVFVFIYILVYTLDKYTYIYIYIQYIYKHCRVIRKNFLSIY